MNTSLLSDALKTLSHPDVRRLAWAMASPSLFDSSKAVWQGQLRTDQWGASELSRCLPWLHALDADPEPLVSALGDPTSNTPLGHVFERLILFWQAARPDVRFSTKGLIAKQGSRTVGEFDVVMLRHDGVIETLEVTVKYYLNLNPALGIDGCIGPRAFDRMSEKFNKMTTRQTALANTEPGRLAICRWLEASCNIKTEPDKLRVDNYALARGYVFHTAPDVAIPPELSPTHGRGLWQTDAEPLPSFGDDHWRLLSGREWLGPYQGATPESGWPNDPAMPLLFARMHDQNELERRFVVRAESGLLNAWKPKEV